MLVNPQCGGSCSWNIYTARDGGLLESEARWLEPHSKETDKGPEDSCGAALSLTLKKKKKKKQEQCWEKIPLFKIQF